MRVLLVTDSHNGFPNLVLMKIAEYYKGHEIDLIEEIPMTKPLEDYDRVFISCIYHQNRERVAAYAQQFPLDRVTIGGSGWSYDPLPTDIEHLMPDYSLYGIDYSMGFTSRGCIRNCGFCIVPEKEGYIRNHAPITEFIHPDHNKVLLLDNNFLASPKWKHNLKYIIDHKIKVNFNQGLDIRLVNEENAQRLAETKYYSRNFKTRGVHFALDDMRYLWEALDGIDTLADAGIRRSHLMFYILINYNSTPQEDKYRAELLKAYGVKPYIMTYNQQTTEWSKHFERYYNGKWHEFIPFGQYNGGILCDRL